MDGTGQERPAAGDAHGSPPSAGERQVLVFTAATASEGLAVKGLLESEGILVFVKGEAEGPYRFGPLDLWVRESEAEDARAAIDAALSGPGVSDPEGDGHPEEPA
jgi:Putative prokaryotic signal transducing protein